MLVLVGKFSKEIRSQFIAVGMVVNSMLMVVNEKETCHYMVSLYLALKVQGKITEFFAPTRRKVEKRVISSCHQDLLDRQR